MSAIQDEQKVKMLLDNSATIERSSEKRENMKGYLKDLRFRLLDDLQSDHPLRHPKAVNWRSAQSVIALFKKHKALAYNEKSAATSLELIEENEKLCKQNKFMSDELELLNKAAVTMKLRLEHLETQNQMLEERCRNDSERADARQAENTEYLAELKSTRSENKTMRQALDRIRKEHLDSTKELESLRTERSNLASEQAQHTRQLKILRGELKASDEDRETQKKLTRKLEAQIARQSSEIIVLTEQVGDYAVIKADYTNMKTKLEKIRESSYTQQQKLIKKTFDNIRLQRERTFFSTWHQNVTAIRRSRFVLLKMKNRRLHTVFARWQYNVAELVSQRNKLKRFASHMMQGAKARIFRTWWHKVELRREEKKEKLREQRLIERAARRWNRRELHAFYIKWAENVKAIKRDRALVARFISKYNKRIEHAVVSRWIDYTRERKRLRHEEEVKNRKIKRAALKWKLMELHAVFNTWHKNVANIVRERRLLERFKSRYTHRIEHSVFSRWHEYTVEKKRSRELVTQFAKKWRNMDAFTRFNRWVQFTKDSKSAKTQQEIRERKIRSAALRWKLLELGHVFHGWAHKVQTQVREKKLLSRFIKKFQRKTELAVFSQWTHFAYESKTQRSRVQRFLKKYKYKVEISAFDSWVDFTEEMKTQRSRVNKFLKKYKYRTEIAAFSRWAEYAREKKKYKALVHRFHIRFNKRLESASFSRWVDYVHNKVSSRNRVARFIKKYKYKTEISAFDRWSDYAKEKKKYRVLVKRFITKYNKRIEHASFDRWVEQVEEKKRTRTLLARFTKRWQNLEMLAIFRGWSHFVKTQKDEREADLIWKKKVTRAMLKWKRFELGVVFKGWHANVSKIRRERALVERFVSKFHKRVEHSVLSRWTEYTRERIYNRRLITQFAKRWKNKEKHNIFQSWKDFLAEIHHEREMENQRSLRVKQAALRWQRRELAAIFHSWRNNIDEIIQNRVLVNRFLLKYNKRHEHAAFSTWYKKIQDRINARKYFKKMISRYERKEEASCLMMWKRRVQFLKENERLLKSAQEEKERLRIQAEREHAMQQRRLKRFILHVKRQGESLALRTWRQNATEQKRNRLRLKKFMKHMKMGTESSVFRTWRDNAIEQKQNRVKLQRFLRQMKMAGEAKIFRAWTESVNEIKRVRKTMTRVLHEICNAGLLFGMRKWKAYVTWYTKHILEGTKHELENKIMELQKNQLNLQDQLNGQSAVIQTLLDGKKLRTSFFVWTQYKENRNKARRILTKIAFSALNVPFLHWHRVAMQIKHDTVLKAVAKAAQQEMEVYRKKRAAAFMRQLRQSGLARIFRGWHWNVVERVHQRNVVNRFVKRWKNQGLAKIFLLFAKNRQIRQHHRHVMTRFFTHLSLKKEKMGFKKWQDTVEFMKQQSREAARESKLRMKLAMMEKEAADKLEQLKIREAQQREQYEAKLHEVRETHAKKVLRNLIGDTLGKTFSAWRHFTDKAIKDKNVVKLFVKRWTQQGLFRIFRTWAVNVQKIVEERRTIIRFTKQWRNRGLMVTFKTMARYAKYKKSKRRMNQRVIHIYSDKLRKRLFKAWHRESIDAKRIRINTENFLKKWRNLDLTVAFQKFQHLRKMRRYLRDFFQQAEERRASNIKEEINMAFKHWLKYCNTSLMSRVKELTIEVHTLRQHLDQEKAFRELELGKADARMEESKMHRAKRMLARWSGRRLLECFETWEMNVATIKHQRRIMNEFVAKLKNRQLVAIFNTWSENVANIRRERYVVNKFVRRWKNKNLVRTFECWRDHASSASHDRKVVKKILKQWQNRYLLKLFRTWHTNVAMKIYRRTNSGRMNRLSDAFERFCRKLSKAKHVQDLFSVVSQYAPAVIQCDTTSIYLFDAQKGVYWTLYKNGSKKLKCPHRGHEGVVGYVARTGLPLIAENIMEHPSYYKEIDGTSYTSLEAGQDTKNVIEEGEESIRVGNYQYISVPIIDQRGPTVAVLKATHLKWNRLNGAEDTMDKQRNEVIPELDDVAVEALRMIGSVVRCSPIFPSQTVQHVERRVMQWGSQITEALKAFDATHDRISASIHKGEKPGQNTYANFDDIMGAQSVSMAANSNEKSAVASSIGNIVKGREPPRDLLKISDLNGSESMMKREGRAKQVNSRSVSPSSSVGELLFDRLDKDKNGVIDRAEFLEAVQNAQGVNALAVALGNNKL